MQDTSATHSRQPDWLLLAGATLGFLVVMLDVTIVNVALHQIGTSLGSGVAGLQWIVNAYTLVFAALILTAGALGDRLGARRVFIAGFALFGIGSLACGSSPTIAFLIAARAFQGIGAAILVPCSLSLINHAFTSEADRNRAVSIWAAGASAAIAAGPVVGGILIATVGWRSIFFVNVPIAMIGIWLVWRYSRETPRTPNRGIDLPGQILAIVALACLAATMIQGGNLGWTHALVLSGFVVFTVATAAFLVTESRSNSPMLPLQVFRNPTFSAATTIGWIINVAFYGLIFVLSLFFQETQGYSPLRTGLAFLPMTAIILPANLASGLVATHTGARIPMVTGQLVDDGGLSVATGGAPRRFLLAPGHPNAPHRRRHRFHRPRHDLSPPRRRRPLHVRCRIRCPERLPAGRQRRRGRNVRQLHWPPGTHGGQLETRADRLRGHAAAKRSFRPPHAASPARESLINHAGVLIGVKRASDGSATLARELVSAPALSETDIECVLSIRGGVVARWTATGHGQTLDQMLELEFTRPTTKRN